MSHLRYHISGDTIYQLRETSVTSIDKLVQEISGNTVRATPALPSNTRFYVRSGQKTYVIVEMRPSVQTLHVNTYYDDNIAEGSANAWSEEEDEVQELKLAMPWQYFVFHFHREPGSQYDSLFDFYVFWAQHRVNKLTDQVYLARVPNIHDNGAGCLGDLVPDATHSIAERVEYVVDNFYSESSEFNMDLGWKLPTEYEYEAIYDPVEGTYRASRFHPYEVWVRDTRRNKFCWQNWVMDNSTQGLLYLIPGVSLNMFDPEVNTTPTLENIFAAIGEPAW